jgi:hypothetical protein
MYCTYYQAHVLREQVWFLTGCLRNTDHFLLERTVDVENSVLEFFVPPDSNDEFIHFMKTMSEMGVVLWFKELPNRMALEN